MPAQISILVPVFNEAQAIPVFAKAIAEVFASLPQYSLELLFIDDGSTDNSLEVIGQLEKTDFTVTLVELSRNFGKEAALSAGLASCAGECAIPMDVDLQDPPELVPEMLALWRQGYDVVLARRSDRSSDSAFKRISASLFYRVHNRLSNPKIPENVGDFRLIDRKVIDVLNVLPETCRYMKGLFAWVGFRTITIDYKRPARAVGQSKFNGWRLWNLALEGITSFSTVPLRIWTYLGAFVGTIGLAYAGWLTMRVIIEGRDVPGYASTLVIILILGGLQLIGIGILGEYLGRTYMEAKRRPNYIIRNISRY